MFARLRFYISHSLNDLRANRRLTFFALLSIAAGVAAIVSLQTLSVMISDTLTGNLQENNKADIVARADDTMPQVTVEEAMPFFGESMEENRFSEQGLRHVQDWIDTAFPGQVEMTARAPLSLLLATLISSGPGTLVTDAATNNQASSAAGLLIDPATYPLYGPITTQAGLPLAEALQTPNDIVLSDNLASLLEVAPGAVVRLSGGGGQDFTVRGIVPVNAEIRGFNSLDFFYGIFGFYYLHHDAVQFFDDVPELLADSVYLRLNDPAMLTQVQRSFVNRFGRAVDITTTDDLREINIIISDSVDQLVTIMGLVSLLIGSIGIINTMQVVVRRRIMEVAVLKTLGLQAGQVTLLFLTEAVIMGVIGSLAGIVLGWGAARLLKGVAETFVATALPFRIAFGPAFNGFAVGVVVTAVFGFLPTLTAGQVRPGIVLRPNDSIIPRAGILRTLFAFAVMVLVLSLIATSILHDFAIALVVVGVTFIAAVILYVLLWLLIWLVALLLPAFRIVDVKMALRQMRVSRRRGATTLLALVVGVFSLSLITLFAGSITGLLDSLLLQTRGNVIVSVAFPGLVPQVEQRIETLEGVNGYQVINTYRVEFLWLDDAETGRRYSLNELQRRAVQEGGLQQFQTFQVRQGLRTLDGRKLVNLADTIEIIAGRGLTPEDAGQQVMVVTQTEGLRAAGVTVGDRLALRFGGQEIAYEVVGLEGGSSSLIAGGGGPFGSPLYTTPESIPARATSTFFSLNVDVEEEYVPAFRRALGNITGVFALEVSIFSTLFEALLGAFTAFPSMVAALGLVVGGVVIANSVALSTMERRKEIAIMKAVGLQRERVLAMLLLENGLLGFIGGLIGVGIGMVGLIIAVTTQNIPSEAIPFGAGILLMLLCIAVAITAAMTTAWSASGEKPLNVLRYE